MSMVLSGRMLSFLGLRKVKQGIVDAWSNRQTFNAMQQLVCSWACFFMKHGERLLIKILSSQKPNFLNAMELKDECNFDKKKHYGQLGEKACLEYSLNIVIYTKVFVFISESNNWTLTKTQRSG